MEMTWVWTGMVTLSLLFGLASGRLDAVANAALEGARSAIELSISMAGVLCLWSGVMEIMNACGLSEGLAAQRVPGRRNPGGHIGQCLRKSPGAGQCGHASGNSGRQKNGQRL